MIAYLMSDFSFGIARVRLPLSNEFNAQYQQRGAVLYGERIFQLSEYEYSRWLNGQLKVT